MTLREVLTQVFTERGCSPEKTAKAIKSAHLHSAVNIDSPLVFRPDQPEREQIDSLKTSIHKLYDKLDNSPALRAEVEERANNFAAKQAQSN